MLFFYGCDNGKQELLNKNNELNIANGNLTKQLEESIKTNRNLTEQNTTLTEQNTNLNEQFTACTDEKQTLMAENAGFRTRVETGIGTLTAPERTAFEADFEQKRTDLDAELRQKRTAFEAEFKQKRTDLDAELRQKRTAFEAEFKQKEDTLVQEEKTFNAKLTNAKIKIVIVALCFLVVVDFVFYMWIKNRYIRKEDNLNAEIRRQEDDLTNRRKNIEREEEKTLIEISTRTIYGQKLHEAITILQSEFNKNIKQLGEESK